MDLQAAAGDGLDEPLEPDVLDAPDELDDELEEDEFDALEELDDELSDLPEELSDLPPDDTAEVELDELPRLSVR